MRKWIRKFFFALMVVFIGILIIQGIRSVIGRVIGPFIGASDRVKGSLRAPVRIVEYVDFHCGPCAQGAVWLRDVMERHPDKIYLEARYYPLNLSSGALDARFAECASHQGKFWEVFYALMSRQGQWVHLPDPKAYFLELAVEMELDIDRLTACWQDPDVYDEIVAVRNSGKELGVSATPTYFINKEMLVGSSDLKQKIGTLLDIGEDNEPAAP